MKLAHALLFCVLIFIPIAKAQDPAPYVYYFSDILRAFVIERADGSDSRVFAHGVIPAGHNSMSGPGWSPSGKWFAFTSSYTTRLTVADWQSRIVSLDESRPPIVLSTDPNARVGMMWSPTADMMLYTQSISTTDNTQVRMTFFDPEARRIIFEHVWDEPLGHIVWSPDGSKVSIKTSCHKSVCLYDVLLPSFEIQLQADFKSLRKLYYGFGESSRLIVLTNNRQLIFHDLMSHQEWIFPFRVQPYPLTTIVWDATQTQAIIIGPYRTRSKDIETGLWWLSLSENRLKFLQAFAASEGICTPTCVQWSPDNTKVLLHGKYQTDILFVPSLVSISLKVPTNYSLWIDDTHFMASAYAGERGWSSFEMDVMNEQFRPVDFIPYTMGSPSVLSPSTRYLLSSRDIIDRATGQIAASTKTSGATFDAGGAQWANDESWAIIGQPTFFPLDGFRPTVYELVKPHDTRTRNLTTCYSNLCAGWLPTQVERLLTHNAQVRSILPEPISSWTVEKPIQHLAWGSSILQLQFIAGYEDDAEATLGTWDAIAGRLVKAETVPFCKPMGCATEHDLSLLTGAGDGRFPLPNAKGNFILTLDPDRQLYMIKPTQADLMIIAAWDAVISPDGARPPSTYRWVGEELYTIEEERHLCFSRWSPGRSYIMGLVEGELCSLSADGHYLLLIPNLPTRKTKLVDTRTGKQTTLNFYAQAGAFSLDGTRLALSSGSLLTVWNMQDIVPKFP